MENAEKRIIIFCGHYGSGKTNLAVNCAFKLKNEGKRVTVLDLDIINPYFRTKDSENEFKKVGIDLIASQYANSSLDIPTLPAAMYAEITHGDTCCVLDVGGDDRGAVALGGFVPYIKESGSYEMIYVVNFYRPHTIDEKAAFEVMKTIESVCGLEFTAIVNNSCLGVSTTANDVLQTQEKAKALCRLSGLPLAATTVKADLFGELEGKIENLFPLRLQEKYFKVTGIK